MSSYADHLSTVSARFDEALAATGFDAVIIYAGQPRYAFQDDNPYPYRVNPLFKYWLPLSHSPCSALYYQPGHKPIVLLYQPRDFWHAQATIEDGEWQQYVDLVVIDDSAKIAGHLGDKLKHAVLLGEDFAEPAASWPVAQRNPQALLDYLHYQRAVKTSWEIDNLRVANQYASRAHLAARDAFFAGASELAIQQSYLAAINAREIDMPYNNIVALNEHGAILHYDIYQAQAPQPVRSFLIDAGAYYNGYCADITRTYSVEKNGFFSELISAMDGKQRGLIETILVGQNYADLHRNQHWNTAHLLHDFGLVNGSVESIVANGYSRLFFPHGLGHLIGLQVHDVAGHMKNPQGELHDRDPLHPFLRLTRTIEENQVFTIEPGLYVIEQLLEPYLGHADFNWQRIDELRPYGGVRIEDSVVAKASGVPENLTRDAFAQLDID